jgi:hypothetical protein
MPKIKHIIKLFATESTTIYFKQDKHEFLALSLSRVDQG